LALRLFEALATTPDRMFQRQKNIQEPQGLKGEPCATPLRMRWLRRAGLPVEPN